jgi:acetate kinase
MLSQRSGLRGISDRTGGMRELLELATQDAAARLAVESYVYAVRKSVGAFAAVLGGLDALVFSGGIGEHAAPVRAAVGQGLGFLGVAIDEGRNETHAPVISADDSRVLVRVIPTNEELEIARAAHTVLSKEG